MINGRLARIGTMAQGMIADPEIEGRKARYDRIVAAIDAFTLTDNRFTQEALLDLMRQVAADNMITTDPRLATAICLAESDGNPWAMRYEENYRWIFSLDILPMDCTVATEESLQKHSWGLMQIMGATAREIGFRGDLCRLIDPETNLLHGMLFLDQLHRRWGEVRDDVISAYNAGHPERNGPGSVLYRNQHYVDRVNRFLAGLPT